MRRLPSFVVTSFSLLIAAAVAGLLYKQAWRIPFIQNYRGAQLYCLLWIALAPCAALFTPFTRLVRWTSVLKHIAIFLGVAVPAFAFTTGLGKVRTSSRDKAVLCNLRQLSAAADQYFLENNVRVVPRYEDLVGPTQYIKGLNPVHGENYRGNFPISLDGNGVYVAEFPNGRLLCYYLGPMQPGDKYVYEPGEQPRWKKSPSPANDNRVLQNGPRSKPAAVSAISSDEALTDELGAPNHSVRTGTMCASCHARKS
jgi:type IV pilus assembly protein PilA